MCVCMYVLEGYYLTMTFPNWDMQAPLMKLSVDTTVRKPIFVYMHDF